MKKLFVALLVALIFGVSGCGLKEPTLEQQAAWEAESGAFPENYQDIVKRHFYNTLFDPYSAHYDFQGEPYCGYMRSPLLGYEHGWVGSVSVNAKNRFGAYVGARMWLYIIRNGSLIKITPQM